MVNVDCMKKGGKGNTIKKPTIPIILLIQHISLINILFVFSYYKTEFREEFLQLVKIAFYLLSLSILNKQQIPTPTPKGILHLPATEQSLYPLHTSQQINLYNPIKMAEFCKVAKW